MNRPQRAGLKPLVVMLGEALEAPTHEARCRGLQRLGDVSLFIAGFFSAGFARKLVDVDYHIAMGGRAYGTLAESLPACTRPHAAPGVRRAGREVPAGGRRAQRNQRELVSAFGPAIGCGCTSCG